MCEYQQLHPQKSKDTDKAEQDYASIDHVKDWVFDFSSTAYAAAPRHAANYHTLPQYYVTKTVGFDHACCITTDSWPPYKSPAK